MKGNNQVPPSDPTPTSGATPPRVSVPRTVASPDWDGDPPLNFERSVALEAVDLSTLEDKILGCSLGILFIG